MKKSESEKAIRFLCGEWSKLKGFRRSSDPDSHPSFGEFYRWLQADYGNYLNFRTTTSVRYDVEAWFDQEFKQTWRG